MMISDHLPSSVQYFVATLSSENFSCGKAENGSSLLTKVCFGLSLLETIKSLIEKAPPHPIEINDYVNFPFFTWTVSSGLLTGVSVVKTRPGIITFELSAIWGGGGGGAI